MNSLMNTVPGADYALDALERSVLFADTLRQRGNIYVEHLNAGGPPLLKFEHELILDGRTLPRPCNYALLKLISPDNAPADPQARPVVVVDPRAGHGPGIGGFKADSEVGVALRAGHPVYFVTFRPQPEEGQTLLDVMNAEARFLEEVIARHPECSSRPVVIGNCQAGWAIASLAAVRPELFGPLMIVGAPMSYWAGGSKLNPMRYSGATLGGAWMAALSADMGAGRFDGAHLVENFEKLNPANTLWSKYYRLWSQVDHESERFLEFERWWGGFFRMTGSEIETIVENLFVGNRLASGQIVAGDKPIDLRNITSPIVVFASWGDNITPPPQALNWIIDTWGDERAIAAAGRTIVYVLHESVGHLGIFVGADIARKEHDQIVTSLDVIESLPPGLYEMKVVSKDGEQTQRWDDLEPGSYTVHFEYRTMDDLRAINPEGREDERLFSTVAKLSKVNAALYKKLGRPVVRSMASRPVADMAIHLHPLRWQRHAMSDINPLASAIAAWSGHIKSQRHPVPDEHPGRQWERAISTLAETSLNLFRDLRDQSVVNWTRMAFGPFGLGAILPPEPLAEELAVARANGQLEEERRLALSRINEGGFAQAVCRIVLAGMVSVGSFERRSLRLAHLLAELDKSGAGGPQSVQRWRRLMQDEARIAAVAPVEAINALGEMLPDTALRERALATAAAVLMIEPTLHHPHSEIIEILIGLLDVDPERVIALARQITGPIDADEHLGAKVRRAARQSGARPDKVVPIQRDKRKVQARSA